MFFPRSQYFPKQLFRRFLRRQILGVVPTLLLTAMAVRIYLSKQFSHLSTVDEVTAAYDRAFLFLALVMIFTVTGITLWTGYRMVLPLGRILLKARSILRREYNFNERDEPADAEEGHPGEWSDLESALYRINKDMQSKDISLAREREEIEAILSAISEAVVAVDQTGSLLFYNSQFAVFFGEARRGQDRLSDFFRNSDVLEAFRATLRSEGTQNVNTLLRLKNETAYRHFSLSIAPLKLTDGQLYGAVGVFHDVSELKRMDQVRVDFVANVSHELRTPLTAIKGYAETLREDFKGNANASKFLETIERNTDRLIALVQDLLSLSALESGQDLEKTEVDLAAMTNRVLHQLESERARKQQKIQTKILVPQLWADAKRLEQVLSNLVENAIKYVPVQGNIEIRWEERPGEVVLVVTDDGPGVPPEHHARIFERFYRVDSARSREQGGTGLGLAIVKHIVQRHGGKVSVESRPGGGAVFLCRFPFDKER